MKRGGRESDERLLAQVRDRKRGMTLAELSKKWGVSINTICVNTNEIMIHDEDYGCEDVRGHYWGRNR